MGDYYKIKKILLICMIVLTIMRIFKGSSVFAADDVNSSIPDGSSSVIQTDNHFETIRNNSVAAQLTYIAQLRYCLHNDSTRSNTITAVTSIYNIFVNKSNTIYFYTDAGSAGFYFQVVQLNKFISSNVTLGNYVRDGVYIFNNVPFLKFPRDNNNALYYFYPAAGTLNTTSTTGNTVNIAIPSIGFYNSEWLSVFEDAGLIGNQSDYNDVLNNIEGTQQLIYSQEITQSYYASENNEILSNTYNYLESTQHTDETSMPFQTITANDPYDFTDFLDNLENILTNENYVSKQFTLTLPNNRSFNFSINPNMTEQLLTRIGGDNIFGIITIMWYMGIYGIIIFDFKRMLNQILSGDWMNITTDSSPIDNVVSASFNATGATSTSSSHSGGDR